MKELLKKSFELANKNILLICMLVIFSIMSSVYASISQSMAPTSATQMLLLYVLVMVAACAGFFNQVKAAVNEEQGKLKFLEGVGDYFLPMLGIGLISLVLYTISGIISSIITIKIYGGVEPVMDAMNKLLAIVQSTPVNPAALDMNVIQIAVTMFVILWILWGVVSFVLLYWVPVLYVDNIRNIFKSYWKSQVFLFKNFWKTLLLFIGVVLIVSVDAVLSALTSNIPLLEVVFAMINYYAIIVFLFAVFMLYKQNSVTGDQE